MAENENALPQEADGIYLDGELYTADDLTYREQHELRKTLKELCGEDVDFADAALIDFVPALVYVLKQRTDPDFTFDDALDLAPKDLVPPEKEPTKKPAAKGKGKK